MLPVAAICWRTCATLSLNWAVKIPSKVEISPVEIRRAIPATENVANEPVWVFAKVNGDRPIGFAAVIKAGMIGVQVCPGPGCGQFAGFPTPVKINVRSRAISGGITVPAGLNTTQFGRLNGWFTGAVP